MVHDVVNHRSAAAAFDAASVLDGLPDGVAVLDARGRFLYCNPAGARACGLPAQDVVGRPSPFPATADGTGDPTGDPAGDDAERVVPWDLPDGRRRELAYRTAPGVVPGCRTVSFRDVSAERHAQRRLTAIANVASSVAVEDSLSTTLSRLAAEILQTDGLVAAQVMTVSSSGRRLNVLGAAGFAETAHFFDRLEQCRAGGARLRLSEALTRRGPVVIPHRYDQIMTDPAWKPLREHLSAPRWDGFVSVPLLARGEPVGVLNVFTAPGHDLGAATTAFLVAMAEQAARAVQHASMLERERDVARQAERQHLARDLHDSVVQTVFSMRMEARTLGVLAERSGQEALRAGAAGLGESTHAVLQDLRDLVSELRPARDGADALDRMLLGAVQRADEVEGLHAQLHVDDPAGELDELDDGMREDTFRIVSEALHNCVKHAGAAHVSVGVAVEFRGAARHLVAHVVDDGRGFVPGALPGTSPGTSRGARPGFGLETMHQRASAWSGTVSLRSAPGEGTTVTVDIPLPPAVAVPPVLGRGWAARC